MPEPTTPIGAPCWIDLISSEPARAAAFYTALFGWTADTGGDPELGEYTMLRKDEKAIAGLSAQQEGNPYGNVWTVYMSTPDAAASADKAAAAGGTVLLPPVRVPGMGTLAMIGDPAGAVAGLWQAEQHRGFELADEPGTPVWFETMSRNYSAALQFYTEVFGWNCTPLSDTEEFRYSQARVDDRVVAGVMDTDRVFPDGVPSFWQLYLGVADTDAACERVVALGGQVLRPAEDSPFGRLAHVADPMGATFRITTLVEQS
ncbi:VOC family protein [Aldersonia sp. NBC_00410]|uniref:VOC family protein n=1 Tax=Aldersonia sp. NBC_00410 TaxID=2975954 RepID=UPI00224CFB74|nr:VOC family protein [Aldersonia sp. NBC_00410]MCX5045629.1 VOC family protein [Aldersonia sp. NBC_00410]